ncbi:MAG TPA: YdcH family protein [Dongiaceae bacterium]|jgi:hypothetical protein|nr:YdcH family protein [Dongiaceae bacterium]
MNIESHVNALKSKHADLEIRIDREEQRPHPDAIAIAALKKQKLKIKEELAHFAGQDPN